MPRSSSLPPRWDVLSSDAGGRPLGSSGRPGANQRDLTPDQLALLIAKHYGRKKRPGGRPPEKRHQNGDVSPLGEIAREYGVSKNTVLRNVKFAAAVETLKTIDPLIEERVVTGAVESTVSPASNVPTNVVHTRPMRETDPGGRSEQMSGKGRR